MSTTTPLIVSQTHHTLHVCTLSGASKLSRSPPPQSLHWFSSGHLLAEATSPKNLTIHPDNFFSIAGEISLPTSKQPPSPILCISISAASRFLALGRADGSVSILDLVSKQPIASFSLDAPVVSIAFQRTSDSRYLACATAQAVSLFSRLSNRLVARYIVPTSERSSSFAGAQPRHRVSPTASAIKFTSIGFSPHHLNLLVAADESGCVNVWDISKNVSLRTRTEPYLQNAAEVATTYSRFTSAMRTPVTDMSFAPAGSAVSLCVGGFDKQLRFFDSALKKLLFSISCAAPVSAVSFATDARHLAVGMTNGSLVVWKIDAESGSGRQVTEVCVDRAAEDSGQDHEISAVRSVHIQPLDLYDTVPGKSGERALDSNPRTKRPLPSDGLVGKGRMVTGRGGGVDSFRQMVVEAEGLRGGLEDDGEEELDLDIIDLDMLEDTRSERGFGRLRSDAPRDSDIFSPIARRTSKKLEGVGNTPTKASSFHETPRSERRAHITFRTPRSRTLTALTPPKIETGTSHPTESREESREISSVVGHRPVTVETVRTKRHHETDRDSDSLDSISGKSPPKAGPQLSGHKDVSHLHGSTVSEDAGNGCKDEIYTQDSSMRVPLLSPTGGKVDLSPQSESQNMPEQRKSINLRSRIARSTSDAGLLHSITPVKEAKTSLVASRSMDMSSRENKFDLSGGKKVLSGASSEKATTPRSESRRLSGGIISDYQPTSYGDGQIKRGELQASEKITGVAGLAEELRIVIAQELELMRFELRKDVVGIHSELVIMAAQQSQEVQKAFVERDRRVRQLEEEVVRLKQENDRLKRKYGLGL